MPSPDMNLYSINPRQMEADLPSHPFTVSSSQQSQWAYPPNTLFSHTEPSEISPANNFSRKNHVSTGPSMPYGFNGPSPMYIDPTLDPTINWLQRSADQQPDYLFDDMLAGAMSSSSPAPLLPASSSLSSADPSSNFTLTSDPLGSSQRPSCSDDLIQQYYPSPPATSSQDQGDVAITSTNIATAQSMSPVTIADSPSTPNAKKDASKFLPTARSKLTITIEEPNPETVADLMGILAKSKAKMKLELS